MNAGGRACLVSLLLFSTLLATNLEFLVPEATTMDYRPIEAKKLCQQGNLMLNKGDLEESLNLFTRAIHLDDSFAAPWSGRAVVYCKLGKYRQAYRDITQGLFRNTGRHAELAEMRYIQAVALNGLGRRKEAIESLELCLRSAPNNIQANLLKKRILSGL